MSLALAPASPANARIANAGELENHTVIAWDPVDPAVSCQVLVRETDQPDWTVLGVVEAGAAPSFQCPLSKDNYFFAVRSVSPAGHPSLPSVAR